MKVLVKTTADPGPFHRCGRAWTKAGVVVDRDELSKAEWERLAAEPMLHIGPAPDEAELAEADTAILTDELRRIIAGLDADGFGKDGKPKLEALRAALPKAKDQITAELRDQVWAALTPTKPAPGN